MRPSLPPRSDIDARIDAFAEACLDEITVMAARALLDIGVPWSMWPTRIQVNVIRLFASNRNL